MRGFREEDLDAFAAMSADPEVMRYLRPHVFDRAQTWREIALHLGHWELRGYGHWALVERESGAFVGRSGLWRPEGWPGVEVGWALAREHWGKGYATEAARAALQWGHEELGIAEVCSLVLPENEPSARVAERLGARYERMFEIPDGWQLRLYRHPRPGAAERVGS